MTSNVIIAGDLCPVFRGRDALLGLGAERVFGRAILERFAEADVVVANLECPLVSNPSPVEKTGPTLGAPVECAEPISKAGFSIVNLANNHIRDHGDDGVRSTVEACGRAGIVTVGAGENPAQARRVAVVSVSGIRVGFLAASEHEFSIVGPGRWGANPIEPFEIWREFQNRGQDWDVIVVLLHSGMGHYPYPTPAQQRLSRWLIELGASAVIHQHSHCAGCYEQYRGGLIVYGQGNLFFDWLPQPGGSWHEGFLVGLRLQPPAATEFEIAPFVQCADSPVVSVDDVSRVEQIRRAVERRSAEISSSEEVERLWRDHCEREALGYLVKMNGNSRLLRIAGRLVGDRPIRRWLLRGRRKLLQLNLIRCETHREVLETVLSGPDRR